MRRTTPPQYAQPTTSDWHGPTLTQIPHCLGGLAADDCTGNLRNNPQHAAQSTSTLISLEHFLGHLEGRVDRLDQAVFANGRAKTACSVGKEGHVNRRDCRSCVKTPLDRAAEVAEDQEAVIDAYLTRYRYERRKHSWLLKCQSVERMRTRRKRFVAWRSRRQARLRHHLRGWHATATADRVFKIRLKHIVLKMWHGAAVEAKQLRSIVWELFERRLGRERLSICAVNLFFSAEELIPPLPEIHQDIIKSVRIGVQRKILGALLQAWKSHLHDILRARAAASMILQRCVRAGSIKATLAVEIFFKGFHMWHRHAMFKFALRKGITLPLFESKLPILKEWDDYMLFFTQRRIQACRAEERGNRSSQCRHFGRWRDLTRWRRNQGDTVDAIRERSQLNFAIQVLLEWNAFCKTRGAIMRRLGVYYAAWATWTPRKKRLRQAKLTATTIACNVKRSRLFCRWRERLKVERVVCAFQLARGLAFSRKIHVEIRRALSRTTTTSRGFTLPFDCPHSSATACLSTVPNRTLSKVEGNLATRRYQCCIRTAFLFLGRRTHGVMLECWRGWIRLVTARGRWRSFVFLVRNHMVRHLGSIVLQAWRSVITNSSNPLTLPDGQRLDCQPLMAIELAATTFKKVHEGYQLSSALPLPIFASMLGGQEVHILPANRDEAKQLCAAVESGDIQAIKRLLQSGVDVNATSSMPSALNGHTGIRRTPLHVAAAHYADRYIAVVVLLLECGASPFLLDESGRTAAEIATNPQIAKLLFEHASRLAQHGFTRREKRMCIRLKNSELAAYDNSRLLWQWLTYHVLGISAAKDEMRQELSKLAGNLPDVASQSRTQRRLKSVVAHYDRTLCINSALTAPLLAIAETRALGCSETTSASLARAIALQAAEKKAGRLMNRIVTEATDHDIEKRLRLLRARRFLEATQRHPLCPVEESLCVDFTAKFSLSPALGSIGLASTQEATNKRNIAGSCRAAAAYDDRTYDVTFTFTDPHSLALALSLAARNGSVTNSRTTGVSSNGALTGRTAGESCAFQWFVDWQHLVDPETKNSDSHAGNETSNAFEDNVARCTSLLEEARSCLTRMQQQTLARDEARLRRGMLFEAHAIFANRISRQGDSRIKGDLAHTKMPPLLRNWAKQNAHLLRTRHKDKVPDDIPDAVDFSINVIPVARRSHVKAVIGKLRESVMKWDISHRRLALSSKGLPASWWDHERLKHFLTLEESHLLATRKTEKELLAEHKARLQTAITALGILTEAHRVMAAQVRAIGAVAHDCYIQSKDRVNAAHIDVMRLNKALSEVESSAHGDDDKCRLDDEGLGPARESTNRDVGGLSGPESDAGVLRLNDIGSPTPGCVEDKAVPGTSIYALVSKLEQARTLLDSLKAGRAATLAALRNASLHRVQVMDVIDNMTVALEIERQRAHAEESKCKVRLGVANKELNAIRMALDPDDANVNSEKEFATGEDKEVAVSGSVERTLRETEKAAGQPGVQSREIADADELLVQSQLSMGDEDLTTKSMTCHSSTDNLRRGSKRVMQEQSLIREGVRNMLISTAHDHDPYEAGLEHTEENDRDQPRTLEEKYQDAIKLFFGQKRMATATNPLAGHGDKIRKTCRPDDAGERDLNCQLEDENSLYSPQAPCNGNASLKHLWSQIEASIRMDPKRWEFSAHMTCLDDAVIFDQSQAHLRSDWKTVARLEKMAFSYTYANLGRIDPELISRLYDREIIEAELAGLPHPIHPAQLPRTLPPASRLAATTAVWQASVAAPFLDIAADEQVGPAAVAAAYVSARVAIARENVAANHIVFERSLGSSISIIDEIATLRRTCEDPATTHGLPHNAEDMRLKLFDQFAWFGEAVHSKNMSDRDSKHDFNGAFASAQQKSVTPAKIAGDFLSHLPHTANPSSQIFSSATRPSQNLQPYATPYDSLPQATSICDVNSGESKTVAKCSGNDEITELSLASAPSSKLQSNSRYLEIVECQPKVSDVRPPNQMKDQILQDEDFRVKRDMDQVHAPSGRSKIGGDLQLVSSLQCHSTAGGAKPALTSTRCMDKRTPGSKLICVGVYKELTGRPPSQSSSQFAHCHAATLYNELQKESRSAGEVQGGTLSPTSHNGKISVRIFQSPSNSQEERTCESLARENLYTFPPDASASAESETVVKMYAEVSLSKLSTLEEKVVCSSCGADSRILEVCQETARRMNADRMTKSGGRESQQEQKVAQRQKACRSGDTRNLKRAALFSAMHKSRVKIIGGCQAAASQRLTRIALNTTRSSLAPLKSHSYVQMSKGTRGFHLMHAVDDSYMCSFCSCISGLTSSRGIDDLRFHVSGLHRSGSYHSSEYVEKPCFLVSDPDVVLRRKALYRQPPRFLQQNKPLALNGRPCQKLTGKRPLFLEHRPILSEDVYISPESVLHDSTLPSKSSQKVGPVDLVDLKRRRRAKLLSKSSVLGCCGAKTLCGATLPSLVECVGHEAITALNTLPSENQAIALADFFNDEDEVDDVNRSAYEELGLDVHERAWQTWQSECKRTLDDSNPTVTVEEHMKTVIKDSTDCQGTNKLASVRKEEASGASTLDELSPQTLQNVISAPVAVAEEYLEDAINDCTECEKTNHLESIPEQEAPEASTLNEPLLRTMHSVISASTAVAEEHMKAEIKGSTECEETNILSPIPKEEASEASTLDELLPQTLQRVISELSRQLGADHNVMPHSSASTKRRDVVTNKPKPTSKCIPLAVRNSTLSLKAEHPSRDLAGIVGVSPLAFVVPRAQVEAKHVTDFVVRDARAAANARVQRRSNHRFELKRPNENSPLSFQLELQHRASRAPVPSVYYTHEGPPVDSEQPEVAAENLRRQKTPVLADTRHDELIYERQESREKHDRKDTFVGGQDVLDHDNIVDPSDLTIHPATDSNYAKAVLSPAATHRPKSTKISRRATKKLAGTDVTPQAVSCLTQPTVRVRKPSKHSGSQKRSVASLAASSRTSTLVSPHCDQQKRLVAIKPSERCTLKFIQKALHREAGCEDNEVDSERGRRPTHVAETSGCSISRFSLPISPHFNHNDVASYFQQVKKSQQKQLITGKLAESFGGELPRIDTRPSLSE